MTFSEVAASLPNGFHDSELQRFEMDYVHRKLQFDLVVWIGAMDDTRRRELYRPARLTLDNVAFFVIEPPDTSYSWLKSGAIRIDAGEGQPGQSATALPSAPDGTSMTWMYLGELNRFLLFSAGNASLEWTGPEENRRWRCLCIHRGLASEWSRRAFRPVRSCRGTRLIRHVRRTKDGQTKSFGRGAFRLRRRVHEPRGVGFSYSDVQGCGST